MSPHVRSLRGEWVACIATQIICHAPRLTLYATGAEGPADPQSSPADPQPSEPRNDQPSSLRLSSATTKSAAPLPALLSPLQAAFGGSFGSKLADVGELDAGHARAENATLGNNCRNNLGLKSLI